MLEAPEVEAHRHKTGHSHVDLILGSLAVVLSLVSVFIAIHHGQTMEKLVAANSWPNISYSTGNVGDHNEKLIILQIKNTGVGPARIDNFELFYNDKPIANAAELMNACCTTKPSYSQTSLVMNDVLPARDEINFFTLPADQNKPEVWETLNKERFHIRIRACYCSVFEECWVKDSRLSRPTPVPQCTPSQPIQYDQP
jgi:hypothetical protein